MNVYKLLIYLFFMYFILLSGDCSTLLNIKVQKIIKNSIWIKHVLIFISIYLFSYILKWFNFEDIVIQNDVGSSTEQISIKGKQLEIIKYFLKTFGYSVLIYILFIISSKNTPLFFLIFLSLIVILTIIYVYAESIDSIIFKLYLKYYIFNNKKLKTLDINKIYKEYSKINNLPKSKSDENFKNIKESTKIIKVIIIIMYIIFIIIIILLLIGFYLYYRKQKLDYKNKFNWIKFLFGTNSSVLKI